MTWAREKERKDERKKEGEGGQGGCSCVSILNNHVCVRALAHHRRTASMVEVLSQRRNNHHCCHIFGPIQHLHRRGRQSERDGSEGSDTDQTSLSANTRSLIDVQPAMMSSAKSSGVGPPRS